MKSNQSNKNFKDSFRALVKAFDRGNPLGIL